MRMTSRQATTTRLLSAVAAVGCYVGLLILFEETGSWWALAGIGATALAQWMILGGIQEET